MSTNQNERDRAVVIIAASTIYSSLYASGLASKGEECATLEYAIKIAEAYKDEIFHNSLLVTDILKQSQPQ